MTQRDNPLGVECFEFCEFAAPDPQPLCDLFESMGFTRVARHKNKDAVLYRQGGINFIVNNEPNSFASKFTEAHGPCCPGFALRVADPKAAQEACLAHGAKPIGAIGKTAPVETPMIMGIGDSILYLTDGPGVLEEAFEFLPGMDPHPKGFGLTFIDHLTHNVYEGNMDQWADYYTRLFNFFEVKYFDIRGSQTGLRSRAMTAPTGAISIPINESSEPSSQINEYLREYKGEGVQHIALYTESIYETVEAMRERDVEFLDTPDTYYEVVDQRIPEHGEDLERMRRNRILIDADPNEQDKQLLQIFTQTNIGPLFFEIIQRKGNEGFGEGNFQALFEAIERDQEKRGVL